jgi:hypothetical protein
MSDVMSPGAVTGRCHKCGEFTYAQATHECSAALELVRLREGIGRLRGYYADSSVLTHDGLLMDLDALLDDNEGER